MLKQNTIKNFFMRLLLLIFAMSLVIALYACKPPEQAEKSLTLDKLELTLPIHGEYVFTVTKVGVGDVVWSSSNPNSVTVDSGKIIAISRGFSEITAEADGITAKCRVTVNDYGFVPSIKTDFLSKNINMIDGDIFDINPRVAYEGAEYTDAAFSYEVTGTSVAVSQGIVTAQGLGKSQVRIYGEWRGITRETLFEIVEINVVPYAFINFDIYEALLYTNSPSGETTFVTPKISVIERAETVENPDITWHSFVGETDTAGAAEVVGNTIYARKEGTIEFYAKYESYAGTIESGRIAVTVMLPVVVRNDISLDFDLSAGAVLNAADIDAGEQITKVFSNGNQLDYDLISGEISGLSVGENTLDIYLSTEIHRVKVVAATKIIRQASELNDIFANRIDDASVGYTYGGYFILGGNIDASGTIMDAKSAWIGDRSGNIRGEHGFQGVFDGRGFTVSNLTITENGIFGNLGAGSVVKNVSFTELKRAVAYDGWHIGMIATQVYGARLENVQVISDIGFFAVMAYVSAGTVFKNVMLYTPNTGLFHMTDASGISADNFLFISNQPVLGDSNDDDQSLKIRIKHYSADGYNTNPEFLATDFAAKFKAPYWGAAVGKLPVFSSTYNYYSNMMITDEMQVYLGESINIAALFGSNLLTFEAGALPQGVTFSGGVLSIGALESSVTVNITVRHKLFDIVKTLSFAVIYDGVIAAGSYDYDKSVGGNLEIDLSEQDIEFTDILSLTLGGETIDTNSYTTNGGKLIIYENAFADLTGELMLRAGTPTGSVAITVIAATKIIRQASELNDIFANRIETAGYPYSGYFILGGNIDASGVTMDAKAVWDGRRDDDKVRGGHGFQGTFDGRGFTIRNLIITGAGIFGNLGAGSVVKNVAFTEIKKGDDWAWPNTLIAVQTYGATLENLFISTDIDGWGILSYVASDTTFRNVVIYSPKTQLFQMTDKTGIAIENFLYISNETISLGKDDDQTLATRIKCFDSISYRTDPNFTALNLEEMFDCSENGMWTISSSLDLPVFKTSI